jgi:hypothetical protein
MFFQFKLSKYGTHILKYFWCVLFLINHKAWAAALDKSLNVFFAENSFFIQKEQTLFPLAHKISLEKSASYTLLEIEGAHFCKNIFYLSKNLLFIKDPLGLMTSYSECSLLLSQEDKKQSVMYRIGLNRTFQSWCQRKKQASLAIQKTVDAVLQVAQARDCEDRFIRNSLANARMLNLVGQDIEDVSPLGSLIKLRALWLDNNEIFEIGPLSTLKNLIVLSLSNNHISNIGVISHFKNLQWLFLSTNQIQSVESLSHLNKIKVLSLKDNNIKDLKPLLHFSTNALILAHGNPFQKDPCEDFQIHKQYLWLEKLCKGETVKKHPQRDDSSI